MSENNLSKQRGQSIILVAVVMVALVIFAAITVDVSNAYYNRRTAQNAADAAALAGAEELGRQINSNSFNSEAIEVAINDFAERNGIEDTNGVLGDHVNRNVDEYYLDSEGVRISEVEAYAAVPADAAGIEAVTYITAPTFFGGIVGFDGYPLQAEAAVVLQIACDLGCVVPIALHTSTVTSTVAEGPVGECFNIWNGDGPGNFGWLNWSLQPNAIPCDQGAETCSSTCLEFNLDPDNCNSGMLKVGDWVGGKTGDNNAGPVRNQLKYYIDTPKAFVVPIYNIDNDGTGCGGPNNLDRQQYRVAGFAVMQLLGFQLSQGQSYKHDGTGCKTLGGEPRGGNRLTAEFLSYVTGNGTNCVAIGTVRSPRLTK